MNLQLAICCPIAFADLSHYAALTEIRTECDYFMGYVEKLNATNVVYRASN